MTTDPTISQSEENKLPNILIIAFHFSPFLKQKHHTFAGSSFLKVRIYSFFVIYDTKQIAFRFWTVGLKWFEDIHFQALGNCDFAQHFNIL